MHQDLENVVDLNGSFMSYLSESCVSECFATGSCLDRSVQEPTTAPRRLLAAKSSQFRQLGFFTLNIIYCSCCINFTCFAWAIFPGIGNFLIRA